MDDFSKHDKTNCKDIFCKWSSVFFFLKVTIKRLVNCCTCKLYVNVHDLYIRFENIFELKCLSSLVVYQKALRVENVEVDGLKLSHL